MPLLLLLFVLHYIVLLVSAYCFIEDTLFIFFNIYITGFLIDAYSWVPGLVLILFIGSVLYYVFKKAVEKIFND